MTTLGARSLAGRFMPAVNWGLIPHGVTFRGSATSVAVDASDRVYVFNRGNHPLITLDTEGNVLDMWSDEGRYTRPHSVRVDATGNLFLIDDGGHFIEKRNTSGELQFVLGTPSEPAPWQSGEMFNRPTDLAVHPLTSELFVSDGYGNSRIHRFDPDGRHIDSWGEPGSDPGQFSLPHGLAVTADDRVLVCDRENFRIQIFTLDGSFIEQWHMHRPVCITAVDTEAGVRLLVGEHSPHRIQRGVPRLGCSVKILDGDGKELARLGGDLPGHHPGQFMDPHSIAVDSHGSIYVAEVCNSWVNSLDGPPPLGEWPSLRKWNPVEGAG